MEFSLSTANTMSIKDSFTVGSNNAKATYKIDKKDKKVILEICTVPDGTPTEEIDRILDGSKLIVGDGLLPFMV